MKIFPAVFACVVSTIATTLTAAASNEFHVATNGNDGHDGTLTKPWKTISCAAQKAQPGDVITVHAGTYRECISPPRGGQSDTKRIVYQAAPGEKVEIKGSEVVTNWTKIQADVWKASLPNSFFGGFNPYSDLLHGDWFESKGREHHTGAVYLNGDWLAEAAALDDVLNPASSSALWFARVGKKSTTIWAQFKEVDPNRELVEINVRRTAFYPKKTGINFITVRGFALRHAATPWAPPTAEQIGLIGTHWSKGWIIESNSISHSVCSGISLGKYGDAFDNTSANAAEGYVKTIERALQNGWNKDAIGGHIVRHNDISHCEQAGIVGSLGPVFSTITDNSIHDIHVRRLFTGAEMAGIKFHGAVDVQIARNHIYRTCLGLWLDWMAQGTRVSGNLLHDNGEDAFVEVDHGPFLMDNNLFLSPNGALRDCSQGGAYVHNLFAGKLIVHVFDGRQTPFLKAHSTEVAGFHANPRGDDRFYNNVFVDRADMTQYDTWPASFAMEGNVFLNGAKPSKHEAHPLTRPEFDPGLKRVVKSDCVYLEFNFDRALSEGGSRRKLVTTELLGRAAVPNLPFEKADGSPIQITTDYSGKTRNAENPAPGPFEELVRGKREIQVW